MNIKTIALTIAFSASIPAWASLDLAKKNACMACHAADKKLVGPAYQDVAKKYSSQKDAAATLAKSIKAGGSGKWGPVPMPPQAALSDADATTLATWILSGAK
jgi:cytochrome c